MILIDATIFMCSAGAQHPHKAPSVALLRRIALGEIDAAVDAEVLQEILHRYRAIRRWEEGRQVYALARRIVPLVVAITDELVDRARDLLDGDAQLGAGDALHAAVVLACGMEGVSSYDRDLDRSTDCGDLSRPRRKRQGAPACLPPRERRRAGPFRDRPAIGGIRIDPDGPNRQRPRIGPGIRSVERGALRPVVDGDRAKPKW